MSDRIDYPDKMCPCHGLPLRRVGPLYYCPVATPADEERVRAERLAARMRWVTDIVEAAPCTGSSN